MTHKDKIELLLIKGELTKAIEELLNATKINGQNGLHNNLILQSARNLNNEEDNRKCIISNNDYKRERARVNHAVQAYLNDYLPVTDTHVIVDRNNPIQVQVKATAANISTNRIFISYSSDDRDLCQIFEQRLRKYLTSAKNKIEKVWSDVEILVGSDWNNEIQRALDLSDIGILLVSPMFLGSNYGMAEFHQMMERRKSEGYKIVPVLLRECNFQNNEELGQIQFVKTYKSEYGITNLLEEGKLIPFDELVDIPNPNKLYLNKYFLKVTDAIDKAISK